MGSGTQDPLRGGLFSFGGSIQQSCGLLHGEERRPPEALGRSEAPPARDFALSNVAGGGHPHWPQRKSLTARPAAGGVDL